MNGEQVVEENSKEMEESKVSEKTTEANDGMQKEVPKSGKESEKVAAEERSQLRSEEVRAKLMEYARKQIDREGREYPGGRVEGSTPLLTGTHISEGVGNKRAERGESSGQVEVTDRKLRDSSEEREKARRAARVKNVIIKGRRGRSSELQEWISNVLTRNTEIERVEERRVRSGRVEIVALKDMKDKEELLKKAGQIWVKEKVGVEKDRTFKERAERWKVWNEVKEAKKRRWNTWEAEKACMVGDRVFWKENSEESRGGWWRSEKIWKGRDAEGTERERAWAEEMERKRRERERIVKLEIIRRKIEHRKRGERLIIERQELERRQTELEVKESIWVEEGQKIMEEEEMWK